MAIQRRKRTALFIGRFQPFHQGHARILSYLLRRYGTVRIAIGSAQARRQTENPYSAQERRAMIQCVVRAHRTWEGRTGFAYLADYRTNEAWVQAVRARFPPDRFVVASANPLVRRLMHGAGYRLDPSPLFRRERWEGRRVRAAARSDEERWIENTPAALRDWMRGRGAKILRETDGSDERKPGSVAKRARETGAAKKR